MSQSADPGAAGVVPATLAARWDQAGGRLFGPLVMDPEQYQRVVLALADLLERLRQDAPTTTVLLELSERAPQLAAESLGRTSTDRPALVEVEPELLGMAALGQRHRELLASEQAHRRLAVLAEARAGDRGWTVLEESGDPQGDPYRPYRRLEADPDTGRALLVRCDPDEDFARCDHSVEAAEVDLRTGELRLLADDPGRPTLPDATAREARAARLRERHGPG